MNNPTEHEAAADAALIELKHLRRRDAHLVAQLAAVRAQLAAKPWDCGRGQPIEFEPAHTIAVQSEAFGSGFFVGSAVGALVMAAVWAVFG